MEGGREGTTLLMIPVERASAAICKFTSWQRVLTKVEVVKEYRGNNVNITYRVIVVVLHLVWLPCLLTCVSILPQYHQPKQFPDGSGMI